MESTGLWLLVVICAFRGGVLVKDYTSHIAATFQ